MNDDRNVFEAILFDESNDCETCGPSYDEITGEVDEDGEVSLYVRYGCYSGHSYYGTPAEVREGLLRDYPAKSRDGFDNPKAFDEALHWLAWVDG